MKPLAAKFSQRLRKRLLSNSAAMQALEEQLGIGPTLAARFRLGLSEPYPKTSSPRGLIHQDVLVAPVPSEHGTFYSRYVYQHLLSVTIDNRIDPPVSWTTGNSETYFSRKLSADDSVIVCDRISDLWAVTALIEGSSLDKSHVVIAPTERGAWPTAWLSSDFWKRWKRVNVAFGFFDPTGQEAGPDRDGRARELARYMERDVHRLPPHAAPDWLAARRNGMRYAEFHSLLKGATLLKPSDLRRDDSEQFMTAESRDLSCSYARGFLYEAVQAIQQQTVGDRRLERLQTLIVRSDRTLHSVCEMPCPPQTPKGDRVFRLLPDGSLLRRAPTASTDATWRWQSIEEYLYRDGQAPPLAELLRRAGDHLQASVWLPFRSDYALLACVIAATYCQQIFDAVPLVLVTGPKGSGKTELSIAVSRLCANSPGPVGLISAATLTRLVDASHGFVAIDDLEKIVSKRSNDPQFCDIVQTLKLSYKKETAQRMLTDINQDKLLRLNIFGIKLINNTRGADEILGSRMLTISTRPMPVGQDLARSGRLDAEGCAQLRDHFHTWTFSHVADVARTYAEIYPNVSTRDEEIFAPIRVLTQLSGSDELRRKIDEALGASRIAPTASATAAMEDALMNIVVASINGTRSLRSVVTVLETQMRLRLREGRQFGKTSTTEISDIESPEWIGRQFRDVFSPVGAVPVRLEMHGKGTRAYQLSDEFLAKAVMAAKVSRAELDDISDPRVFCGHCPSCDYQDICEMRAQKQRRTVPILTPVSVREARLEKSRGSGPEVH